MVKKSNYSELSKERIKEIVRAARNSPNRQHTPWVYRGEILYMLASALETRATIVMLDNKEYDIIYKDDGRATVRPSDGSFVPCAHIIVEKFLSEWEMHVKATKVTRLSDQGK